MKTVVDMVLPDYEEDDVLKALRLICADPQATLPFRRNTSPQATAPKKLTPRQPNFVHRLFSKRGHVPSQTEVSRALDITKAGELRIDLLAKAQTDQRRVSRMITHAERRTYNMTHQSYTLHKPFSNGTDICC